MSFDNQVVACALFFLTHYAIPICLQLYQLWLKLCPKFADYAQTMPIISGWSKLQGRIQRLKKGGPHAHRVGLVRPRGARCALNFSSRTYNAQRSRTVWGHAPLGKFFKFRPYVSASEAVGDHHNHAKCLTVTLVIHRMIVSRSPFPFGISLCM